MSRVKRFHLLTVKLMTTVQLSKKNPQKLKTKKNKQKTEEVVVLNVSSGKLSLMSLRAPAEEVKVVQRLPCKPHVSPHPDSGLTYIQRAGWDRAVQMTLKADQLAAGGLTTSPDRGFHALHHILNVHLVF